jgi:hypothetical protein
VDLVVGEVQDRSYSGFKIVLSRPPDFENSAGRGFKDMVLEVFPKPS